MIIDFFDSNSPKRPREERIKILERLGPANVQTKDYLEYGYDYFDNPNLGVGYGGYRYDGRYKRAVQAMVEHYNLRAGEKILEVGCAKGFILVEFHKLGFEVYGIDASSYAVQTCHPEVAHRIQIGDANNLPFQDNFFDFVLGKEILPHVAESQAEHVVRECIRVSKGKVFFEIGCGNTKEEIERMKAWDRTQLCVQTPQWWEEIFNNLEVECDRHYKTLL